MYRYQKREQPYILFVACFLFFILAGFLAGGVYGLNRFNFTDQTLEESMLYVLRHPILTWNEKSLAFIGIGFIAWVIIVSYLMYYYRDFSMYDQGSAAWLDARKASQELADKNPQRNRIITQNLRVSMDKGLSNNNMLIIGSSGSAKTTGVMHQNLLQFSSSYIVLDVKGDTQRKLGNAFLNAGYTIKSLNFKEPTKSDRYNPFVYIENEEDLLRTIKALHEACRPKNPNSAADPFWDDAIDLYLSALFYYVWLEERETGKIGTMPDVLHLCNMEAEKVMDPETEEETTRLKLMMDEKADRYGDDYPPVKAYRKLKDGASETVGSVILMINGMLTIADTAEVRRIFSGNDIDIRELGGGVGGDPTKKTVLFLVMPDNNNVYNWIISMFYTQCFDIMVRQSDIELHAPLPIEVQFWMDEFYAGSKPADPDVLLGVVRSRNISMIPILQSVNQLKTLYPNEKYGIIFDNVATVLYLGSGPAAEGTHKFISELLGKATIDSRDDNVHMGSNGNTGLNFKRIGRELMTPEEVKKMPRTDCIAFLEGHLPIYDSKAIPFDWEEFGFRADPFLKKRYNESLALGAYEHPVFTVYDPIHFNYITVEQDKGIQFIEDKKDIETYMEAAQYDANIYTYNIREKDLLYLSWGKPKRSQEEIEELLKNALEKEKKKLSDIRRMAVLQDVPDELVPNFGTGEKETDKSGWNHQEPFNLLIKHHWDELSAPEQEEICLAMDEGLTEEQLRTILLLPLAEMAIRRRAFVIENSAKD